MLSSNRGRDGDCSRQTGMTLIELMLAMALASVVLVATSGLAGLIVRSAGQRDAANSDTRAVERVTGLMEAEFKQLTRVVDVSATSATYETAHGPLADVPVWHRSQIICLKDDETGHWTLIHRTQPLNGVDSPSGPSMGDGARVVSRPLRSHLTECWLEAGVRQAQPQSGRVHVQWTSELKKVAGANEWWLRVHLATPQGARVPLFLGRVSRSA